MSWGRRLRRRGYAYPIAALAAVLTMTTGCGNVLERLLEPREVGPDADEMAKDPLLHLTFSNAGAGGITATTGKSGYKQDHWSHASRSWDFHGADRQGLLLAAVDAADGLGATFWELTCTTTMTFRGTKEVSVGDTTIMALVRVTQPPESRDPDVTRADLRISLSSSGNPDSAGPPDTSEPVSEDCPQALVDKFDELRPTGS